MIKECCTKGINTLQSIIEMLQEIKTNNKTNNKTKVKRIYEDENWIIDKIGENIRVSYFKDCHFVDEKIITKDEFGN